MVVINNQQQQQTPAPTSVTIIRQPGQVPNNNMELAIISMLCCVILGTVAIIQAAKVCLFVFVGCTKSSKTIRYGYGIQDGTNGYGYG